LSEPLATFEPMVTPRAGEAVDPAVAKLCAQEGALTGVEDAQMSSRYRWLVTRPASHALLSAAEAPVCLQKRSANRVAGTNTMKEKIEMPEIDPTPRVEFDMDGSAGWLKRMGQTAEFLCTIE
jgi:hypothetical protein